MTFSKKKKVYSLQKQINPFIKVQKDAFFILGEHLHNRSLYGYTDKSLDKYRRNNIKQIKIKVKKNEGHRD